MADTSLRVGDRRHITFTLKYVPSGGSAQVAYDLSSVSKVILHKRLKNGTAESINTTDDASLIAILSATAGTVKLTPDSTYWDQTGTYEIYITAQTGSTNTYFPDSENLVFVVKEAF